MSEETIKPMSPEKGDLANNSQYVGPGQPMPSTDGFKKQTSIATVGRLSQQKSLVGDSSLPQLVQPRSNQIQPELASLNTIAVDKTAILSQLKQQEDAAEGGDIIEMIEKNAAQKRKFEAK